MSWKRQIQGHEGAPWLPRSHPSPRMPSDLSSALPPPGLPLQPALEEGADIAAAGAVPGIGIGRIAHGTPAFRATSLAMFFGGFATFAMLYGLQPLMPMFSDEFALSPAAASGVVSAATGALALMLIPASL